MVLVQSHSQIADDGYGCRAWGKRDTPPPASNACSVRSGWGGLPLCTTASVFRERPLPRFSDTTASRHSACVALRRGGWTKEEREEQRNRRFWTTAWREDESDKDGDDLSGMLLAAIVSQLER
ncbi:hypothetical protein V493_04644 [Pseudogymnoascus sp. VKM F-4281 (FW-2241)]|nr:hypothetical protein V493_04644 [Pseudogymnoascus sp. VKM F-4281 (FW-2241)]